MPYPLPLTRTEAYLAYKAGVIQQSDLKPSLAVPRNGIDAWLAYWTGLASYYPIKNLGKNIIDYAGHLNAGSHDGLDVSLDDATGQITVSGQPTRGYAKIVNTYDITNLLEDGKEYTMSQSAYDKKLYAQVNAIPPTGTPTYIYSTSSAKTFTVDKTTYPRYNLTIQTGAQSAWTEPQTITRTFQIEKGSSASAFEPYTGEPLILQEEEAYIAYLCGVINEYPEKCLRRVGAYLRYLISARWGRPDHPLNREELYLSLIKTQVIPSGDPSSDIVIDGTAKAPFVDVKMYGDTKQQHYTGKNLFDIATASDVWIKETGISQPNEVWKNSDFIKVEPNTAYTLSGSTIEGGFKQFQYHEYSSNNESSYINQYAQINWVNSTTFTTHTGCNFIRVGYRKDALKDIQLEAGSTATSYEPYVGGTPSPNPDYPQQIQTVTGEQTVTVVGKNLFDKDTSTLGILNGDGTIGSSNDYFTSDFIRVVPETMYHKTQTTSARFKFYNINKTPISSVYDDIPSAGDAQSFTTPSSCYYIRFSFKFNTKNSIQIELGSTASSYAPYSKQTYPINLGKNLFNKDSYGLLNGYLNGISGKIEASAGAASRTIYIPCNPNTTYTVSKVNSGSNPRFCVFDTEELPADGVSALGYVGTPQGLNTDTSLTYTTKSTAKYLCVFVKAASTEATLDSILATLQIEAGTTATTYAPYFEPIELCKLGTYQDYIWKDGEDWKMHKATAKAIFKDIEWHTARIGSTDHYRQESISIKTEVLIPTSNSKFVGACSGYTVLTAGETYGYPQKTGVAIQFAGYITSGNICVYDPLYDAPNQADNFKAARANTKIYYALATPTDTAITNQALIDQLEALVSGGAENGTTYIKVSATDPNLPGLLYVEAPKYE